MNFSKKIYLYLLWIKLRFKALYNNGELQERDWNQIFSIEKQLNIK